MIFQYYVRAVYGQPRLYPHGDIAQRFAALMGVKTFSPGHVAQIRDLGFNCQQVLDPKNTPEIPGAA